MAARYIKANSKVAEYLKLEHDRNRVTDGNYLLWQADMLAFGRLTELPQILEQIGGLALQAHEAREEQDGTVVRKLPVATDPRFIVEEAAEQPGEADTETGEEPAPEQEPKSSEDGQGETEQPITEEPVEVTDPKPQPEASEETKTGEEPTEAVTGDDEESTETTTNEKTEA